MVTLTRRAIGASSLALMAGCATGTGSSSGGSASTGRAAIGSFGVDLAGRDLAVRPGDDFFQYANGTWARTTEIPSDRTRWGTFDILREMADNNQRVIIEEVALAGGAPGSNQQKIADYYNAYLDQAAIDARGLAPLQPELAQIAAITNHEQAAPFGVHFRDEEFRRAGLIGKRDIENGERAIANLARETLLRLARQGGIGLHRNNAMAARQIIGCVVADMHA